MAHTENLLVMYIALGKCEVHYTRSQYSFCTTCTIAYSYRERSGSVVECLTRDRRAAGSSLTGVTTLWSFEQDTFILA